MPLMFCTLLSRGLPSTLPSASPLPRSIADSQAGRPACPQCQLHGDIGFWASVPLSPPTSTSACWINPLPLPVSASLLLCVTSQASPARQAHQRDLHQEVLGGDLFLEEGVGGGGCWAHFRHRRERPDLPLATNSPRGALRETPGRVSGPRSKACDRSPCGRSARSGAGLLPASLAAPSQLPGRHGAPGAPKGERGQALVARSTLAGWVFPPEPCAVPPRGSVAAGNGTRLHPSLLCWGAAAGRGVRPKAGGLGAASAALVAGLGASPISSASGRAGSVSHGARGEPGQATQSGDLSRTWDGASCLGAPQLLCTL